MAPLGSSVGAPSPSLAPALSRWSPFPLSCSAFASSPLPPPLSSCHLLFRPRPPLGSMGAPPSASPATRIHGPAAPLPRSSLLHALPSHPPGGLLLAETEDYLAWPVRTQSPDSHAHRDGCSESASICSDASGTAYLPGASAIPGASHSRGWGQRTDTGRIFVLVLPPACRGRWRLPSTAAHYRDLPCTPRTRMARAWTGIRYLGRTACAGPLAA